MPEESGLLSIAQAMEAIRPSADDESKPAATDAPVRPKTPEPAAPAAEDNAQIEGGDAADGEEVDELSDVTKEALAADAAKADSEGEDATKTEETADADDTASKPSVEPPTGWTAVEVAWFKTLPPEGQEIIAKRERDLRANESRRHQEHQTAIQAAKQAHEAEIVAARTERQHLSAALQAYANPKYAQFAQEFADLIKGEANVLQIQEQDPLRFQRYQAFQTEFAQINATEQAIRQRQEADADQQFKAYRDEENAKFREVAGVKSDEEWHALDKEVSNYLLERGIPAEHIRNASAIQLEIVRESMIHRKEKAAKAAALKVKPVPKPPKPVVVVQKPGVGQTKAEREGDSDAASLNRLTRTGRVEDALPLMRVGARK